MSPVEGAPGPPRPARRAGRRRGGGVGPRLPARNPTIRRWPASTRSPRSSGTFFASYYAGGRSHSGRRPGDFLRRPGCCTSSISRDKAGSPFSPRSSGASSRRARWSCRFSGRGPRTPPRVTDRHHPVGGGPSAATGRRRRPQRGRPGSRCGEGEGASTMRTKSSYRRCGTHGDRKKTVSRAERAGRAGSAFSQEVAEAGVGRGDAGGGRGP